MQYRFYIDQTRCIGCFTCVVACRDWHDVPAGPTSWIRVETVEKGKYPDLFVAFLPVICYHCLQPACIPACPVGAITKRDEDGIVLINQDRCRGLRFCQEACPYKEIYYNTVTGTGQKCIFCLPRVEEGVATACSRQCPGRVRFLGFLNDEAGPIHKLVHVYKVALPLHPEFGTQPNVFYIPPLSPPAFDKDGNPTGKPRIPLEYLESLFGPGVQHALDTIEAERQKRRRGETSELMDILISRRWLDMFGPFDKAPRDIEQAFR